MAGEIENLSVQAIPDTDLSGMVFKKIGSVRMKCVNIT